MNIITVAFLVIKFLIYEAHYDSVTTSASTLTASKLVN